MNDVSRLVQNMKAMGTDMYNEVSKQNQDIDRIKTKADIMDDQARLANKRVVKFAK